MKLENLARATDLADMRAKCVSRLNVMRDITQKIETNECIYADTDYTQIGKNGSYGKKYEEMPKSRIVTLGQPRYSAGSPECMFDSDLVVDMYKKQIARLEKRIKDIDKELELL